MFLHHTSSGGAQHPAEAHPVTVAGPGSSQVHAVGTDESGEGDEIGFRGGLLPWEEKGAL